MCRRGRLSVEISIIVDYMLFNSYEFLLFLPIVFLCYWFVFKPLRWQNLFVVLASYVFYGWWDWRFLLLIAFTTMCSFASGLAIEHFDGKRNLQRAVSALNIVVNLAVLGVFKYYNFFAENFSALLYAFGLQADWPTLNIVLPVGISFYTFQALSYSIDVYRRKIKATKDIIAFFAFISFFPQLVAGPIERATNLLPQFLRERRFDYAKAADGCRQILWGFFKKIVVADNLALVVDRLWDGYTEHTGLMSLMVGVLFSFQIYCDFSGYSDIAIGVARLFGIKLMRNFSMPYFSRSIPEFWRRWHISLTTWFRDYIYFPMGGSRCSKWRIIRNVYVVWGISGLWHGANWTFVCWGLFHATLLAVYNLLGINTKYEHVVAHGRLLPTTSEVMQMVLTFFFAVIGWIIFRSENMSQAVDYLLHVFSPSLFSFAGFEVKRLLFLCLFLMVVEWTQREREHALESLARASFLVRWLVYLGLFFVIAYQFVTTAKSDFIYFQF